MNDRCLLPSIANVKKFCSKFKFDPCFLRKLEYVRLAE